MQSNKNNKSHRFKKNIVLINEDSLEGTNRDNQHPEKETPALTHKTK